MAVPFLTGLSRVLDAADVDWKDVPGWETRKGYDRGYGEIYGAVIHTTEWSNEGLAREDAPALKHVTGPVGSRPAHTYNILIGRSGKAYLVGAGPGWQAGGGSWPTHVSPNPGVRDREANFHTIGISMDANASKYPVTEAQLVSLVKILVQLRKDWGGKFDVIMHGEWQPKGTPGAEGRTDPTRVPGGWDAIRKAVDAGAWPTKEAAPTVAAPTKVPTEQVVSTAKHVVRSGYFLWQVAEDLRTTVPKIVELNKGLNPDQVRDGQTITVPARTYKIKSGDSLGAIASAHGGTVAGIARLNNIKDVNRISPDTNIIVPA